MANPKPFYLPADIRQAIWGMQRDTIATWLGTLGSNSEQGLDAVIAYSRSIYASQQKIGGENAARARNARLNNLIATKGVFATYYLSANIGELQDKLNLYALDMQKAVYTRAAPEYVAQANNLLAQVVAEYGSLQAEGAFPKEYLEELLTVISTMPSPVLIGNKPSFVYVQQTDIFRYLGDYEDFVKGWHYGALEYASVEAGVEKRVSLPWVGGPDPDNDLLLVTEPRRRYGYWHALQQGKSSYTVYPESMATYSTRINFEKNRIERVRHSEPIEIPIKGSWAETKSARLAAWAPKAPQWLLLEYGQHKWKPTTMNLPTRTKEQVAGLAPGAVTQAWIDRCALLWRTLVTEAWTSATITSQRMQSHAAGAVTFRGSGANARWHTMVTRTIGGKIYRRGSFIPTLYAVNGPEIRALEDTFRKDILLAREMQIKAFQITQHMPAPSVRGFMENLSRTADTQNWNNIKFIQKTGFGTGEIYDVEKVIRGR